MKKIVSNSLLAVMAVFSILLLANISNAQPGWAKGKKYSKGNVDQIIKRVENRTDVFVKQFDNALDNSKLDGTRREDNLNQRAKDLESATDELRSEFNRRENWWETRENVSKCLNIAADINVAMRRRRFNKNTENNWKNVRKELNTLAQTYNLPPMGAYR